MTVKELIERLQECDPDAEVFMDTSDPWHVASILTGADMDGEFYSDKDACLGDVWLSAEEIASVRKSNPAICLDIEGEK